MLTNAVAAMNVRCDKEGKLHFTRQNGRILCRRVLSWGCYSSVQVDGENGGPDFMHNYPMLLAQIQL